MDYLKLEHLSVGYNKQSVVDDININIKKGEIVALIGPNGAGKSTILKSIARELDTISGNIFLDGKNIHDYTFKELSSKMAVILTERIKVELMTCRDIVATGRYPYTGRLGFLTPKDEEKINEALETVQAFDIAYKDFNRISDGQRQRILLARALCQEPEIILLDEPTSFLDVKHKLELLTILTNLARQKKITVLTSLHEIDLAEKVADRIVTVKGKELFGFGKPEEVFEESNIRELYDIKKGFFDPLLGNIELSKPEGKTPAVFVIAGGGTGIPVFRKLQRENIPFAAGILYTNDIDYRLARLLATEVITEKPFEEISDETFEKALMCMNSCKKIINASPEIGSMNKKLEELIRIAEKRQEQSDG
jgi:iron complex transport system ATP-binding protein